MDKGVSLRFQQPEMKTVPIFITFLIPLNRPNAFGGSVMNGNCRPNTLMVLNNCVDLVRGVGPILAVSIYTAQPQSFNSRDDNLIQYRE